MKGTSRRAALSAPVAVALLALATAGCGSSESGAKATSKAASDGSSDKVKMALVLPCQTNDLTWCQRAYEDAKKLEDEGQIKLEYTTDAPFDTAAITPIFAQYAQKGNQLVVAHSTWTDAVLPVAKKFPKVNFAISNGAKTADNVATYDSPLHEPAYLAGMLAGGLTKTNVIGGVGAQQFPACVSELNAFLAGAKRTNPKVKQLNSYTGDWADAGKAKQAVSAQAAQRADVFIPCGDGPSQGMISAIKGTKMYGFSYIGDQSSLAPDNIVGSLVYNLYPYFKAMVADVKAGKFRPGKAYKLDYSKGAFTMALNPKLEAKVPAETMEQMKAVEAKMKDGSFTVPYEPK